MSTITNTKRVQNKKIEKAVVQLDTAKGLVPPHDLMIEEAVLGAMLTQKDAILKVIDILSEESFYTSVHKKIFNAIKDLFNASTEIDIYTVITKLRATGDLEYCGNSYYIAKLSTSVSLATNIEHHARIITELALKRGIIDTTANLHYDAYDFSKDAFDILDIAQQNLFELSERSIKKNFEPINALIKKSVEGIIERGKADVHITGVTSGFAKLDEVTGGFQKSDLIIIAGRPGMGKTAFVLCAARNAAVIGKKSIMVFSLEMGSDQLVNRLISTEARISSEAIKTGKLSAQDSNNLLNGLKALEQCVINIDTTATLSILELKAKCRRMKQSTTGLDMVVIDYLQLMTADSVKSQGGNREQEISLISRSLKALAKELDIPVIALSQLSRQTENRAGSSKRPMLSDLRESGAIEQDADIVMFLYRPEYYKITEWEDGTDSANSAEVIIAKHRNGSLDEIRLGFIGQYTKFENLENAFGASNFSFPTGQGGIPTEFDLGPTTIKLPSKLNQNSGMSDFDMPGTSLQPFGNSPLDEPDF